MSELKYKAVVFDLDGTAIDSKYNITAFAQVYRAYFHKEPSQTELERGYGMTARNAILYVGVPEEDVGYFEGEWVKAIMELCETESHLYEGIWGAMCEMHDKGIVLGINTSRRMEEVTPLNIYVKEPFLELCDVIVTCDQVKNPKPAADSLNFFMERTGFNSNEVLFIGDSEFDSGCAKNAGCDFALAVWGSFAPDSIPATYKPQNPSDILALVY